MELKTVTSSTQWAKRGAQSNGLMSTITSSFNLALIHSDDLEIIACPLEDKRFVDLTG